MKPQLLSLSLFSIYLASVTIYSLFMIRRAQNSKEATRNPIEVTKHRDLDLRENQNCKLNMAF